MQVHLTTWALDDGAVEPFRVGDRIAPALGIAVEQLPIAADPGEADRITPVPTPVAWGRVRARADVVGPVRLILDADGTPFSALVTPFPEVPLVFVGPAPVDPAWSGDRILVRGDVVIEPYLWEEGGIIRNSIRHRHHIAVVERIRTLMTIEDSGAAAQLVDVTRTVPHQVDAEDYLVDLRIELS